MSSNQEKIAAVATSASAKYAIEMMAGIAERANDAAMDLAEALECLKEEGTAASETSIKRKVQHAELMV